MTNEQAIKRLKHLVFEPTIDELDEEALNMAIEALSVQSEPITININYKLTQKEYKKLRKDMVNAPIILLPSVQPERNRGEWIDDGWHGDWAWETDGHGNCWHLYKCSLCNKKAKTMSNFCPNCGAEMKGESNEI